MDIYIKGKKVKLSPQKSIGKGGEADVFDLGNNLAVKIFKQPDHPDYQGLPFEQKAAELRLKEHQLKLRNFPQFLPSNVITPQDLATDRKGQLILGYTMTLLSQTNPLLRYSDRNFRTQSGINQESIIKIFLNLYDTIIKLHQNQVVIGDFNDLNVLINQEEKAYFIDADSFQFQNFYCQVFTSRFVDPLLCDPLETSPILIKNHNKNSDWYAYHVMLMQCLLFVNPYGGVYKPKDQSKNIPHTARPLHRITIFDPEVKYPKPALPYSILSDDLLQQFHRQFLEDQRGIIPLNLLQNLRWTKCVNCGIEHARLTCPFCTQIKPQLTKVTPIFVKGSVTVTSIFKTEGIILVTNNYENKLTYLYYEKGEFKREDQRIIFTGKLNPKMKFWLQEDYTLIGQENQVISFTKNGDVTKKIVDRYQNLPMLQTHQNQAFWCHNGQLLKDGKLGQEYIADVLQNQTQFWLGSNFGFGFYRAGNLNVAFTFDFKRQGINDQIKLPILSGQILEINCILSDQYAWLLINSQQQGQIIQRVFVIDQNGQILANLEAIFGDQPWLNSLDGHCAINNFLLVATDEGIVRIELQNRQIVQTKIFTDTESFVDSNCQLLVGDQGLYVISEKEIKHLKIK